FALEEGGVGPQRLQHHLFVAAQQRFDEHGGVAQVRRHADLGHRHEMRGERIVVDVAALQYFREHMAHLLADPEGADRTVAGFRVLHLEVSRTFWYIGKVAKVEVFASPPGPGCSSIRAQIISEPRRSSTGAPYWLPLAELDQ